ncbi:MAG: ABC transporter permease [Defluviitaleaceae bacterium]|nr:ABC transporter permease [Defluviitaleaceae bacterium]
MDAVKSFFKKVPIATLIIFGFWALILIVGFFLDFRMTSLFSDTIQRFGMWGLFVLAMVPSIQSGTGPNFALPIGVVTGLFAMVVSMDIGFIGFNLLIVSTVLAIVFGCLMGWGYGKLMNAVKGSEMAIATYTGFAATFFFSMIWLLYNTDNDFLGWFIGRGLRNFVSLTPFGTDQILDNFWQFEIFRSTNADGELIGGLVIPTGTLLVVLLACLLMWLFFRSKHGIAISAVGMNPMFAKATGLNADRSRVLANMISTVLAAVGIIVYAQSFGFMQLYDAPLMMAFPAVAAVLVGGATAQRSKVIHVIIGTILLQGLITNGPPVFGRLLEGADITDAVRMIVQNGIILYALAQMKGGGK